MFYQPPIIRKAPYDAGIWKGAPFGLHWHSEIEILISLRGSIVFSVEDNVYMIRENEAVIAMTGECHEVLSASADNLYLCVEFGHAFLEDTFLSISDAYLPRAHFNLRDSSPISCCLNSFRNHFTQDPAPPENDWLLRADLYLIACEILRNASHEIPSAARKVRTDKLKKIHSVLEYVARHYQEPITLEDAAAHSGYCKTHFCRIFKSAVGLPFLKYLNSHRVDIARQYLKDPELPVATIAELTGFPNVKQFGRVFKEYKHCSPTEYRKKLPVI